MTTGDTVATEALDVADLCTELLIDGQWRAAQGQADLPVVDPSTGRLITQISAASAGDVEDALAAADGARARWRAFSPRERGQVLYRLGSLIRRDLDRLAWIESVDTGKPLRQARVDVEIAARYFEFYAGMADKLYGDSIPLERDDFAVTLREPMGITGHIIPWNYPIAIGARTVAPAVAAGNACVVKPAEEAPLTMLQLGELALQAGIPPGVINVVPGLGEVAGAALSSSPRVDHISFTGGLDTGRLVMTAAATNVRPVMLELGGKSPSIVFVDADLDRALPVITNALIQNSGQTCSACSRVIVHRSRSAELIDRLSHALDAVALGAGPADPDMGPVISAAQRDRVTGYLDIAAAEGAAVYRAQGSDGRLEGDGYFVAPTMLTGVRPDMRVAQEEIFGPVIAVLEVASEAEALEVAEATPYGLIAAVWTQDVDQALRAARALRCGQVYINSYGAGGGVDLPFGGFKQSGFGREKGLEALREYMQVKTIAFSVRSEAS
jgi:aldehyde dehydrogenase (NAD+)